MAILLLGLALLFLSGVRPAHAQSANCVGNYGTPPGVPPGLLDGYGFNQYVTYGNTSAALFGQLAAHPNRLDVVGLQSGDVDVSFHIDHGEIGIDAIHAGNAC